MKAKSVLSLPLLAFGLLSANAATEPVVLTIDGEPVYKSEFEYVYNKNNSTNAADKMSVADYVDLFVNYKLKVLNAKEDGYDQQRGYRDEFNQYREQLAMPYFMNNEEVTPLLKEAYERLKVQVACSHILVKFDSRTSEPPYVRISRIKDELDKGAKFTDLAKKYSDCPSGKDGGYLGNVTCFQMVYPFENVVYSLKPGQVSEPFQTKFGYHIVQVLDVKPNITKKKTSQIFVPEADGAEQKVDSLLNLLRKGADFKAMATKVNVGAFRGDGAMPWITIGSSDLPPEVLFAVSQMEKVGDLQKQHSRIGWHIFRLDSTNTDIPFEKCEAELRQQVIHSDRMNKAHDLFLKGLYERYDVNVDSAALKEFEALALDRDDGSDVEYGHLNKPLYSFLDETFPQSDFVNTFKIERRAWNTVLAGNGLKNQVAVYGPLKTEKDFVNYAFSKFLNNAVVEKSYEKLKDSEPEYRNLLHEYSDGLLLFNVSSDKVWNTAAKDADGLAKFFAENKEKYKWSEPRFRGRIVHCANAKVKKKVAKFCEQHKDLSKDDFRKALHAEFATDGPSVVSVYTGLYAKGANKAVDYYMFKVGDSYTSENAKLPEVVVYGELSNQPIDFTEVRGAVVADYQNKLEEDWVKKLRQEHVVVINQDVLKTIK